MENAGEFESGFRDTKDLRFGMGMASIRVNSPERRDRLWLLNAFAIALLTLLGAAGEALGYDRHLKSNTSKKRTHSLFRQGAMLYELKSRFRKSAQDDKWSFCLTLGTLCPANQE